MPDSTDPSSTDTDTAVSDYLHETMADLQPDVHRLVAGAVTRGRRIRRRRRLRTAALAAAAVVIVAGGGLALPRLLDAGGSDPGPTDLPSATATPSRTPSSASPTPQPEVRVAADDLGDLVTDLFGGRAEILPPSATSGNNETGGDADERHSSISWQGFGMTLIAERTTADAADAACSPGQNVEVTCTTRPDGATLVTWTDGGDGLPTARSAAIIGERWTLSAIVYNSTGIGDGTILAPEPPLTLAQLTRLVTSDGWYR